MKTINTNFPSFIKLFAFLSFAVFLFNSCITDYMVGKTFKVSDERMVDEWILQKDTDMTLFLKAADKAGFRGMLHAYGTNTCFIPTNKAIKAYCKHLGIDSLQTLPIEDLEKFMKFHIVRDTIESSQFIDGRLATATMSGKYLTTKPIEGTANILINRQANIIQKDIRVGNGIIHKIDSVLTPNPKTVKEMIEELPSNYSLFKLIMKDSGIADTLGINTDGKTLYTVLLQSDESFKTQGITDLASLIAKMKIAQPDYATNPAKLEEIYARFHCIKRLAYVADLSLSSAELTLAVNQVLTLKTNLDSLILNEYQSLTKFEQGVAVNKKSEWTDRSCSNGVLIDLAGYIQPIKRGAEAVYWEITDQPEIKKMKEYRKLGTTVVFNAGDLSELTWGGNSSPKITYYGGGAFNAKAQYSHYDYFDVPIRPNSLQWLELKTPVLAAGTYYVWICFRRGGATKIKATFKEVGVDDQILPNVIDLGAYFDTAASESTNLSNGSKRYNAKQLNSVICSKNCGAIKVDYTGRHTLRIDALSIVGSASAVWLDMIHFIPVDQDQLWPRFDVEGKAIYQTTPCAEIAPSSQTCN
jgi:uncharacterized surface protein with fasciclin (FAS1) repeats